MDIDRRIAARMKKVHTRLNKSDNDREKEWGCSTVELADYIPWIVPQEDINYSMPKYLGKHMPFYRYLEAVCCAVHFTKADHCIPDVAIRALSRRRVEQWADYSQIEKTGR